jgi:Tol biopolymer transport system component
LERFQREAETLAALDHPNIVTIHSVEEVDGVHFLTMQLVEGKRLSQLIPRGGMPLERIFTIAIPLADALAAAHEKGVIHRDLKPGNVMVTDDGRVKVLDVGLAKLRYEPGEEGATELPTEPLTDEGRVLGTVPYMSPEQVEGKPLDHRSDLFSLGVMLYEMTTGKRPFEGDSPASTMSAILRDTPSSVTDVRDVAPRQLARIIRRCLVKEPERRFQTARELAIELEELQSEVASGEAWGMRAPPLRRGSTVPRIGLAVVAIAAVMALGSFWLLRGDRQTGSDRSLAAPTNLTKLVFDTARKGKVSASPDGRFFAYASNASGNWDIYLQRVAGGRPINLTEDSPADDLQPAFSPDGESIAFRSEREGGGIFVMGATGEAVRRVNSRGYFPDWSPDSTRLVFSTSASKDLHAWGDEDKGHRIWIIDLQTGGAQLVVDQSAMMPSWSTNGEWIAYYGVSGQTDTSEEMEYNLFTVSAAGGNPNALTEDVDFEHSPAWSPDSRTLYYVSDRGGSRDLWRVTIDQATGARREAPERMTTGSNVAHVSAAGGEARILFSTLGRFREILRVPFDPVHETTAGPAESITPPALQARHPEVSADGEWIAFDAEFGHFGSWAIGVVRRDGSDLRQVTESGYEDVRPSWSPDGQQMAFYRYTEATRTRVWIVNIDGGGLWLLTDTPGATAWRPEWSPDGSRLAMCTLAGGGHALISGVQKPWSEEPPELLPPVDGEGEVFCPTAWSADGEYLAGVVTKQTSTGVEHRVAVYSLGDRKYRVLTATLPGVDGPADIEPDWLVDGERLFFKSRGGSEGGTFSILELETADQREVLRSGDFGQRNNGSAYMVRVSPDKRELFVHWYYAESSISMLTLGES